HERHRLLQIERRRTPLPAATASALLPLFARRRRAAALAIPFLMMLALLARTIVIQHRFIADELVTVLLQNRAGERLAPDHENRLVVLLQLVDQRHKVAVAADDSESGDVVMRERKLESVEGQINVAAVLVAPRRRIALHH